VAVPLAYEQPGIAARLAHHGCAAIARPTAASLDAALERALNDPALAAAAARQAVALGSGNGCAAALARVTGVGPAARPAPQAARPDGQPLPLPATAGG
jgi:zeaxanthin glucosyltransferase